MADGAWFQHPFHRAKASAIAARWPTTAILVAKRRRPITSMRRNAGSSSTSFGSFRLSRQTIVMVHHDDDWRGWYSAPSSSSTG